MQPKWSTNVLFSLIERCPFNLASHLHPVSNSRGFPETLITLLAKLQRRNKNFRTLWEHGNCHRKREIFVMHRFNFLFLIFHEYKKMIMTLQMCLAVARDSHTKICRSNQHNWHECTLNECQLCHSSHTYSTGESLSAFYILKHSHPTLSLNVTCRASPGGRPSVAPDSWVSPFLCRSNRARWSACVARRSPQSGRGRRADGGWTQWARGPGTFSGLCGSASCCTFPPCWGPPCCR